MIASVRAQFGPVNSDFSLTGNALCACINAFRFQNGSVSRSLKGSVLRSIVGEEN